MDDKKSSNVLCQMIKLNQIQDNVLRLDFFSESYLQELTSSIKKDGLLESLLIHQDKTSGVYTLLNGHYRVRALRRLQIKEVSCQIILCDEANATSHYLASFIRKTSLTALEEGHIITGLVAKGYAMSDIGKMWFKSISWISRRVKLLKDLDADAKTELKTGSIFPRVAQELARLPQGKEQKRVLKLVKDNKLTKDETANLVDRWLIADENTRGRIEQELSGMQINLKKPYIPSPEAILQNIMKQCKISLENLVEVIEQTKEFRNILPWEEYHHICRLFKMLADILDTPNSGKEDV